MVKVGDSIPSIPLVEGKPDQTVDLSQELGSGSGIIIGVPAAFSMFTIDSFPTLRCNMAPDRVLVPFADNLLGPTCSDSHIPGYISHPKLKSAGKVDTERYGSRWDVAGLLGLDEIYELEKKYGVTGVPVA